jgi:23S rRNA (guanosine2251-2'-O)-methyltransferase
VREALRAGRRLSAVLLSGEAPELEELAELARLAGVAVRRVSPGDLDVAAQGVRHQGAVALGAPPRSVPLADLAGGDLVLVLDGVTDPQNLGACARAAEQAGAAGMVIRERRGAGLTPAAEKAAAGALSWLPVAVVPGIPAALQRLSQAGLWTVALTADGETTIWETPVLDERVALVVGAEGEGLSRLVAERVDVRAAIPAAGHLDSLNAAAAAAVALFEARRRRAR